MISYVHNCEVISVQELQSTTGQAKMRQHYELSRRRPEQVVEWFPLKLLQQRRRLPSIHLVEANTDVRWVTMDDGKLRTDWLPSERLNRFLDFY